MNDLKGIIEDCYKSDLVSDKIIKKIIEIIGQEEWQDLHDENNDICTTMGELIITLNGVADLEKENAELNRKNKELGDRLCNVVNNLLDSWCKGDDPCPHLAKLEQENKVLTQNLEDTEIINKALEKENAKLETDYEVLSCSVGDFGELQEKLEEEQKKNNGLSDNLTKAKELLNEFMRISKASDEDFEHDYSELIAEAEQFLKEIGK